MSENEPFFERESKPMRPFELAVMYVERSIEHDESTDDLKHGYIEIDDQLVLVAEKHIEYANMGDRALNFPTAFTYILSIHSRAQTSPLVEAIHIYRQAQADEYTCRIESADRMTRELRQSAYVEANINAFLSQYGVHRHFNK